MSTSITFNGVGYTIPAEGDNYGDDLSSYLIAIASGALQKTGGTFTLSSEVNFGGSHGLKSVYLKSQAINPASSGIVRLGNTESVSWRNTANSADLSISVNGSDRFTFNSIEMADISSAQTFTNKTLTSPVISSPTGLTKADVGLSNVDNTSDTAKNSAVAILTNKTIDATNNTISNITNANISASAGIAYSKLALSNSIVNADISTSAAIAYSKLSLSNSILNADISASAAIALSKLAATTASRALVSDASGYVSASSVTSTELGHLAGVTSAVQTQLDSKIAKSLTTTTGDMIYASSANNPSRLAIGSSGQVLKSVGGIPTWATFSGGINYLSSNPDAEADTAGWSTYSDAAGTSPVDGTGGSPNITWTRTTSAPLRGSASFLFTKDAANRQGQGVSYPFTIDSSDKAKVLQISFDYMVASGTFVAGDSTTDSDLTVWIYDVTNASLIQPSSYRLLSNSSSIADKFTANFQSASNSTSYRLIIHNGRTSASAYTVLFDNFNIGPTQYVYGTPITDWSAQETTTGTHITTATYNRKWRREGDSIRERVQIAYSGAATATTLQINTKFTIDVAKLNTGALQNTEAIGIANLTDVSSGLKYSGTVCIGSSATQIRINGDSATGGNWSNSNPTTIASGDVIEIDVLYPAVGLSSSVQMSDQNDGRTYSVSLGLSAGQSITSGSAQKVNFDSIWRNTHGTVDTTNKRVTAPLADWYKIHGQLNFDFTTVAATIEVQLRVNGTAVKVQATGKPGTSNTVICVPFSFNQQLNSGDYVEIFVNQGSGSTLTIRSDATAGQLSVLHMERDSNGSNTIAASETVLCHIASGSIANSTTFNFGAASIDTHGGWNGSTTYTVPASGIYEIGGIMHFNITATAGQYYNLEVKVGGVVTKYSSYRADGTAKVGEPFILPVVPIRLTAGQQITFGGNTNYSSVTPVGDQSYMTIKRVGL